MVVHGPYTVKMGLQDVLLLRFTPADRARAGIEVAELAALYARSGGAGFTTPHRLDFHLLALVTSGKSVHTVDFATREVSAGSVFWVRPHQVQQWGHIPDYSATVVLFEASAITPSVQGLLDAASVSRHSHWQLDGAERAAFDAGLRLLTLHYATDSAGLRAEVLRHTLAALLLSLGALTPPDAPACALTEAFDSFRRAVDSEYSRTRSVTEYARRLGYSEKTLTRATRSVTGLTAKEFIDQRVMLEAKRLLAHSQDGVARIGAAVGFDDTANFAKYFSARATMTPTQFRHAVREQR